MPKKGAARRLKKVRVVPWEKLLFLSFLGGFVLLSPGQNFYTTQNWGDSAGPLRRFPLEIPTAAPYPSNITGVYPTFELVSAEGIVILDIESGVFLYKRNAEQLLAPASVTKIMTALVVLDVMELDDIVTVQQVVTEGQVMGLVAGEQITVENLLLGALVHSGNDAAYALAYAYPGGLPKFIDAMNEKAKKFYMNNTHFTNPVGFDDPAHKTTPFDLARLASVALSNKTIARMVAIPQITISDTTHTHFHVLKNVNELLGKIPGVGGIKTGWTEEARENLVTLVERDGHRVIIVTLKSKDRFLDTSKLIDWVFANHEWQVIAPPADPTQ